MKFCEYHPAVNFLYFVIIIAFSMFIMHPVFLVISLASGITYSIMLNGRRAVKFNLIYMLPTAVAAILINAFTNRSGATILIWTISYEAIMFGIAAAVMIICVICWFSCYNKIMTTDKFIYLFGRAIPSLSLVFSMVFRFVPRFKAQFKKTVNAQKCIGNDASGGGLTNRLKVIVKITSVMMTWAMENSVETADSMKCRGYGLKGRSTFNNYKFRKCDFTALIYIILSSAYILGKVINNSVGYSYYPVINVKNDIPVFIIFGLLCAMPAIIEIREVIRWKYLKSTI